MTIQIKKPFLSRSLSGTVRVEFEGALLPDVRVYRCNSQWENCVQFATTDKNGHFASRGLKLGKYHLLLDAVGFDPLEVIAFVNPVFVKRLRLQLHVGQ